MTAVIGIVGGIGSGKSAVAALFAELGALVLDADAFARRVAERPEVLSRIRDRFGADVFAAGGELDRAALAARVFAENGEQDRAALEAIVHPPVRDEIRAELERARREGLDLVVLDVPLLLTSPFRDDCDRIVFVRASRAARERRVAGRGWDAEELARREARQPALADKERAATDLIDNDDEDLDRLRRRVRALADELVANRGRS